MIRKILFTVIGLGLAGGAGYYGWTKLRGPGEDAGAAQMETVAVKRGPIEHTVKTDGRVEALLVVDVKSKASGAVQKVLVNESDMVRGPSLREEAISEILGLRLVSLVPGQLLVELDPIDEQRNFGKQTAQFDAEKAKVERARAELVKTMESVEADLRVALADRKSAEADSAQADAGHEGAVQEWEGAKTTLADAKSKAKRQAELFALKLTSKEDFESAVSLAVRSQADLEQAEANIRLADAKRLQSEAKLAQSEAKIAVVKANRRQIEIQKQELALAQANLEASAATLADAQRRLDETSIGAPIDGVILAKKVERGQVIASGTTTVGGGTSLLTVADVSQIFVTASVPEADISHVRDPVAAVVGGRTVLKRQPVRITADAYAGRMFTGEVVYRIPQAVTENNVTTIKVRVEVTDKNKSMLMPGMTANVEFLADFHENALLVPASAVTRGNNNRTFVFLQDAEGKPKRHPVKVGIITATMAEIREGLAEGDLVITSAAAVEAPAGKKGERDPRNTGTQGMQRMMPRSGGGGR
jgi:HlyD family secretion protein